ncbi:MAG: hypothetical protein QNI92_00150 [Desulfobacterales bacterium]|nr:hypothetical protein [Desulfobacterales bacterium]MDJ0912949.1 hypothetical protein [Desulfobacterales bacterium]
MEDDKKIAAAISAVMAYIKTEEDIMLMQASAGGTGHVAGTARPAPAASAWGLSGRQQIMQMGSLMQVKAFHGRTLP